MYILIYAHNLSFLQQNIQHIDGSLLIHIITFYYDSYATYTVHVTAK